MLIIEHILNKEKHLYGTMLKEIHKSISFINTDSTHTRTTQCLITLLNDETEQLPCDIYIFCLRIYYLQLNWYKNQLVHRRKNTQQRRTNTL